MTRLHQFAFVVCTALILSGCNKETDQPVYQASEALPDYNQSRFAYYQQETRDWLLEHRVFMTKDKERELSLIMPQEFTPTTPNGEAVLLVHGLGDSPFSFKDIGRHLASKGYLVRTILLPGHASKVGDLQLPVIEDWQGAVEHHIALIKKKSDKLWLGGFSTGGNLVTEQALQDDSIQGLLLFAPAYKPTSKAVRFADIAGVFVDWVDIYPEVSHLRYNSLPMNGAAVYYQTSANVREQLKDQQYDKPVFMLLSEGDKVIDTPYVAETFSNVMVNPHSQLVWLGEQAPNESRVTAYTMKLDEQKISNGSHMGMLFSPLNSEYGTQGTMRICNNGQGDELEARCLAGEEVWYSAWGYTEPDKVHARLTYNPYFEESMQIMDKMMQVTQ
ncbi:alpha/beta hydrolase [Vibrio agarivorans]|uniref:Alpha/beta hydrolase n=1 Tax=Vibrio agarivorans TaxID=153622 RepID=A0ABT7Y198_9VIBR|nr:alpha/beta hydrolase [Vibrio agarivorans]